MEEKELGALIKLLDDPDDNVFRAVKGKLNKMGTAVIPSLEKAWESSLDELFQTRIENIIQEIHHKSVKAQLKKWVNNGAEDLFTGVSLITKFQYPEVNIEELRKKIEKIKKDIWLEINDNLTALEKIKIINHIVYDIHGFARSSTFQNSPQGHFINQLLGTKKGSPMSLAILYSIIAQELNIPVYGVALPKNFILCYKDKQFEAFKDEFNEGVLFYINPFNKGVVFGKKEIEQFIKQQQLENKKAYFQPCSNKETIIHLLNALIDYYSANSEQTKVEEYKSLLKILYF